MELPSHKPPATRSDRTDCTSVLLSTAMPKSWLNRPGKRRMRARRFKGRVGWRGKADQCSALQGPEAAAQQASRGWPAERKAKKRGKELKTEKNGR
jgi:hypothetical protein